MERLYQLLKFHAMSDFTKLLTFILIFGKKCMHERVPKKTIQQIKKCIFYIPCYCLFVGWLLKYPLPVSIYLFHILKITALF